MNGVSVIICAHNSASRLQPTLEAIARCRSEFAVEVIIVDNNSTDDTASHALGVWSATGNERFKFLVVREAQSGLAYARRAGTKAASRDIIVFCDDDNWLCEDYLMHAIRIMADPVIGAAGGCSTPTRPERLPPWFYTFSWGYAIGAPLAKINDLPEFPETERAVASLWGAGLVVRRDAMEFLFSLPGFPALTGRNGTTLLSGDDLEISACLACGGYKLVFSEAMRFEHDIAPERLDPGYAKRLFDQFGIGFTAMGQYHEIIEAFESPWRAAIVGSARVVKHLLLRRLNRSSFLSILAALRAKPLLTEKQRLIYDNVQRIRCQRHKIRAPERHGMMGIAARQPA